MLTKEQRNTHDLLQSNFPYFAKLALHIKDKDGVTIPFELNQSQEYIHKKLEDQKAKTGKVRALIVKGRQMGSSTYIGGRYYHAATRNRGKNVFILTHEAESTKKLFAMVKRFHDCIPEPLKPSTKHSNAKELVFDEIDGQYFVGTAGNADVGRGGTVQFLHGSEVAFWKNTDGIRTGVMQSVPKKDNTEVVLESTANGVGNMFYEMCMAAARGDSDYQLIFIPWFWMDEYEAVIPKDFVRSETESEVANIYLKDYPEEQQDRKLAWRRLTLDDLGKEWKFKQEFPNTFTEAFQVSGDSLIAAEDIVRARECKAEDLKAPMIMGVDPARSGDRTVIAFRRGREVAHYYTWEDMDEMRLAGIVSNLIDKHKPLMCNVDVGLGYGTIDRLHERGYRMVNAVHFGSQANEPDIYRNIRAEMWCNMAEWFKGRNINIPDKDELHADLTSVPDIRATSDGTIKLESKENIKKEFGRSPDIGDALALTFSIPYTVKQGNNKLKIAKQKKVAWR